MCILHLYVVLRRRGSDVPFRARQGLDNGFFIRLCLFTCRFTDNLSGGHSATGSRCCTSATDLELNDLAFLCFLVHDLHDRDFLHDLASLGRATDFHGSWSTDRCVVFTFFRAVSLDGLILRFAPARGFADV